MTRNILILALSLFVATGAVQAQRDLGARRLVLDDGFSNTLTLQTVSPMSGSGTFTFPDPSVGTGEFTMQGNVFNGPSQLVQLAPDGNLYLSAATSSVASPRVLGFNGAPAGGAAEIHYYDAFHRLASGHDMNSQLTSWHGIQIYGRNGPIARPLISGGSSNNSVEIFSLPANVNLAIMGDAAQTANLQDWYKGASIVSSVNADGALTAVTLTASSALGAATTPAAGAYYRDNAILAWGEINADGTIASSYGNAVVTNPGTGTYTVVLPNAPSGASISVTPNGTPSLLVSASRLGGVFIIDFATVGAVAANTAFYYIVTGRP